MTDLFIHSYSQYSVFLVFFREIHEPCKKLSIMRIYYDIFLKLSSGLTLLYTLATLETHRMGFYKKKCISIFTLSVSQLFRVAKSSIVSTHSRLSSGTIYYWKNVHTTIITDDDVE